ncbi:MAG: flagellar hook-length control protein FliK [Thiobacillus sp.]
MPALNITPTPSTLAKTSNNLAAVSPETETGDSFSQALAREMHVDSASIDSVLPAGKKASREVDNTSIDSNRPGGKKTSRDEEADSLSVVVPPEVSPNLLTPTLHPLLTIPLAAAPGNTLPDLADSPGEISLLASTQAGGNTDLVAAGHAEAPDAINSEQLAERILSAHAPSDAIHETRLPPSFAPTVLAEIIRSLPQPVQATLASQYPVTRLESDEPIQTPSALDSHLQGNWLATALQTHAPKHIGAAIPNTDLQMQTQAENSPCMVTPLGTESVSIPESGLLTFPATPAMQALMEQATTGPTFKGTLNTPLDNPGWSRALGQQLSWMVSGQHQTAELNIHPADLGPMQVVLSIENRQAELMFVSREPAVREALENALPHLRDMLANAGIQLGQANVSAEQPQRQSQDKENQGSASREQGNNAAATAAVQTTPRRGMGLVDMFA